MSEHEPFWAAVAASPDDDLPRLIYADWLDERGDPRGEFIRIQIAAADGEAWALKPEVAARAAELFQLHRREWEYPARDVAMTTEFERGFIYRVVAQTEDFLRYQQPLFRYNPVRSLTLVNSRSWETEMAAAPALARLRALHLTGTGFTDAALAKLCRSPHIQHLQTLRLGSNLITSAGARTLANCQGLKQLQVLVLSHNYIDDAGAALLVHSRHFHLRFLDLSWNDIRQFHDELSDAAAGRNLEFQLHPQPLPDSPPTPKPEPPLSDVFRPWFRNVFRGHS